MDRDTGQRRPDRRLRGAAFAAAFGLLGLGGEGVAHAHIILISDGGPDTPKDWQVMTDTVGDPQKPTPCGSPSPSMPTNNLLTVQGGQSVTVSWTEIVGHSGHFRIVLAPVSPANATGGTETLDGSTVGVGVLPDPATTSYVDNDAATMEAITVLTHPSGTEIGTGGAIVLADGLFPHCESFDVPGCDAGPESGTPKDYSYTVTIPNTPCTNCTLQVLQFMSYHGPDPSFFYHHCAAVTIVASDGGASSGNGTSDGGSQGSSGSGSAGSSSGAGSTSGGGNTSGSNTTGTSGGSGGGQSAGGSNESNGSSGGASSNHNGGGCGVAAGAASIPAAIMALAVGIARRRRARKSRPE